jgi:phage-related protein
MTDALSARTFRRLNSVGQLGRPHCAPLGHGLWEVRSDLDSKRIARVIFCMEQGNMILLHGFIKKTQKAPKQDIDLALKRKREVT